MSEKTSLLSTIRSEGVILAIIPFIGSVVTIVYEAGYLRFFDIPSTFIQIDFVRVIKASFYVALYLAFYFVVIGVASYHLRGPHPIRRAIQFPAMLILLFGPLLLLAKVSYIEWIGILSCTFVLFLIPLISAFFNKQKDIKYKEKLEAELDEIDLLKKKKMRKNHCVKQSTKR